MAKIVIDNGFRELLDPLPPEAIADLEKSLLREGCRDALVVWDNGEQVLLLDGHNRYDLCTKHNIEYRVVTKGLAEIPDRDAAEEWIDANQMARRNMTPQRLKLVAGRRYNRQKKRQGEHKGNQHAKVETGQNDQIPNRPHTTAEQIAKEAGVGEATVRRAAKAVEQWEKVKEEKEIAPALNKQVETGKVDVKSAIKLAELPPEQQETILEDAERNQWGERKMLEEAKLLMGKEAPAHRAQRAVHLTVARYKAMLETIDQILIWARMPRHAAPVGKIAHELDKLRAEIAQLTPVK